MRVHISSLPRLRIRPVQRVNRTFLFFAPYSISSDTCAVDNGGSNSTASNCSAIHTLAQYNLRFADQQAIALGNDIQIVSLNWLTDTREEETHLDEDPYLFVLPTSGKPSVDGTGPRRSGRATQSQSQSQSQSQAQSQPPAQSQPAKTNGKAKKTAKNKKDDEDEDDAADQPPAKKQKADPADTKTKTKAKAAKDAKDAKDSKATKATKDTKAAKDDVPILNVPVDDLVPNKSKLHKHSSNANQYLTRFPI